MIYNFDHRRNNISNLFKEILLKVIGFAIYAVDNKVMVFKSHFSWLSVKKGNIWPKYTNFVKIIFLLTTRHCFFMIEQVISES